MLKWNRTYSWLTKIPNFRVKSILSLLTALNKFQKYVAPRLERIIADKLVQLDINMKQIIKRCFETIIVTTNRLSRQSGQLTENLNRDSELLEFEPYHDAWTLLWANKKNCSSGWLMSKWIMWGIFWKVKDQRLGQNFIIKSFSETM